MGKLVIFIMGTPEEKKNSYKGDGLIGLTKRFNQKNWVVGGFGIFRIIPLPYSRMTEVSSVCTLHMITVQNMGR